MKKFVKILISLLMIFDLFSIKVFAGEPNESIFVSSLGDDTLGDGSEINPYKTIQKALTIAENGTVIELLSDISTNSCLDINKSVTIDGNNFKVTGSYSRNGSAYPTFSVNLNPTYAKISVSFKDIEIINNAPSGCYGRAIETRATNTYSIEELNFTNVKIRTTGLSNSSAITIGNSHSSKPKVNISKCCFNTTYGIELFNPAEIIIDNSELSGWSCIYGRYADGSYGSYGTTLKIKNNSILTGTNNNAYNGSNNFATIVGSGALDVDVLDSTIIAKSNNTATQSVFRMDCDEAAYDGVSGSFEINVDGSSSINAIGDNAQIIYLAKGSSTDVYKINFLNGKYKGNIYGESNIVPGSILANIEGLNITGGIYSKDSLDLSTTGKVYKLEDFIDAYHEKLDNDDSSTKTEYPYKVSKIYVAKIGNTKYSTLQDAVTDAVDNDVIEVLRDFKYSNEILINKSLSLDLGSYTVEAEKNSFVIENGGLTIKGSGTLKSNTESGYYGIKLIGSQNSSDVNYSNLKIEKDVNIKNEGYGFSISNNNGHAFGVNVDVYGKVESAYGTTINGEIKDIDGNIPNIHFYPDSYNNGIYAAGYANWILEGDQIAKDDGSGDPLSGLSIKSGNFIITGGIYKGIGTYANLPEAQYSASEETGAGVSITTNSSYTPKTNVLITGGVFISENGPAFYEGIALSGGNPAASESTAVIEIKGGLFISNNYQNVIEIKTAKKKDVISGGYFSCEIPNNLVGQNGIDYISDGYECIVLDNNNAEDVKNKTAYNKLTHKIGYKTADGTSINIETNNDVPTSFDDINSLDEAVNNILDANKEKEMNGEKVESSTVNVNNSSPITDEIEIDDTVVVIANGDNNNIQAKPGFVIKSKEGSQSNTTEYYAEGKKIGEGYYNGTEAEGIKDLEKLENKVNGSASLALTNTAKKVTDTTDNSQLKNLVQEMVDSIESDSELKVNQGTAARALMNVGTEIDDVDASRISIFINTYYETEVVEDKISTNDEFTLEITPMFEIYASTTSDRDDALSEYAMKYETGHDYWSVKLVAAKEVECSGKTITLDVLLPVGFAKLTDSVYIDHKTASGTKTYKATLVQKEDGIHAIFNNPDGFSEFRFYIKNPAPYRAPKTGVE